MPAMMVGVITVLIPYLIMQPAMGSGIAGSLTANPQAAMIKVIVSHVIFGFALFAAGLVTNKLIKQQKI